MPAPVVDSIAKQTDATKAEIEKHWKDLEKQYKDKGFTGDRLYQAIVGTLKKMYKDKGYKPESTKEENYFQMKTKIVEDYSNVFSDEGNQHICPGCLLEIRAQSQLFHWQTTSYSEHQALGMFYDSFLCLLDKFIESYQGFYGERVTVNHSINLINLSENSVDEIYDWAHNTRNKFEELYSQVEGSTELQNIVDEMKSLADKLIYLLTLN